MKRNIIILVLILTGVVMFGSEAQLNALRADFWVFDNSTEVFYFPSSVLGYPNAVFGERILNGDSYPGINIRVLDNLVLGLYLDRDETFYINDLWTDPGTYNDVANIISPAYYPDKIFELMVGLNLDAMRVGMGLSYSREGYDESDEDIHDPIEDLDSTEYEELKVSETRITLDLSLPDFAIFKRFAFALDLGLLSHKYSWDDTTYYTAIDNWVWSDTAELDGGMFLATRFLAVMEQMRFYLSARFGGMDSISTEKFSWDGGVSWLTHDTVEIDHGTFDFTIGFSREYEFKKFKLYLSGSLEYSSMKWNNKNKDISGGITDEEFNYSSGSLSVPVAISIEIPIKKWLTLYGGCRTGLIYNTWADEDDPDWGGGAIQDNTIYHESSSHTGSTRIYFGTRMMFKNITLDLALDPTDLLQTFIITGESSDPVVTVSAGYNW